MLMEPDSVHHTDRIEGGAASFDVLFVDPEVLELALACAGYGRGTHLRAPACHDQDVAGLFRRFHALLDQHAIDPEEIGEHFLSCLERLFERVGEASPEIRVCPDEPAI